jgi:Tol biopolymer transport system component
MTPLWSRKGNAIAFAGGYRHPQIHVVDPRSGVDDAFDVCASSPEEDQCSVPDRMVWSPDGTALAFVRQRLDEPARSSSLEVVHRDGWPAWLDERAGAALARASDVPSPTAPGVEPLSGQFVLATDLPSPGNEDHYAIYSGRPGGGDPTRLTEPGHHGDPDWSPDASRIAFWSLRETQSGRIYVMNADGSNQHPIVDGDGGEPAWSPDGTTIAYTGSTHSSNEDRPTLNLVSADGGEPRVLAEKGDAPSWSPDGRSIVFADGWDETGLSIVDVETGAVRPLIDLPGTISSPAWSPDGAEIAFAWSAQGWDADIYAVRPDGSGFRRITDGGGGPPSWSPDGAFLAFEAGSYHGSVVYVVRRDGTGQRAVLSVKGTIAGIDWGPDRS